MTQNDIENICGNLLDKSVEFIENALDGTDCTWDIVDDILLVGGCTRIPGFLRRMEYSHKIQVPKMAYSIFAVVN